MNFTVLMDAVYSGRGFFQGLQQIKSIGYSAFEFANWWEKDINKINDFRKNLHLKVTGVTTRTFELTNPNMRLRFVEGLQQTIDIAGILGCNTIFTQGGRKVFDMTSADMHRSIVDGLKTCVPLLNKAKMQLVIEPVNSIVDHPDAYLNHSMEAFEIIEQVGSSRVKVLYDIYHMQVMEGNIISTIIQNIDKIGHIHIAGVPGRHEPYIGELYYISILNALRDTGFKGIVGLEFFPVESPIISLNKFRDWVSTEGLMQVPLLSLNIGAQKLLSHLKSCRLRNSK